MILFIAAVLATVSAVDIYDRPSYIHPNRQAWGYVRFIFDQSDPMMHETPVWVTCPTTPRSRVYLGTVSYVTPQLVYRSSGSQALHFESEQSTSGLMLTVADGNTTYRLSPSYGDQTFGFGGEPAGFRGARSISLSSHLENEAVIPRGFHAEDVGNLETAFNVRFASNCTWNLRPRRFVYGEHVSEKRRILLFANMSQELNRLVRGFDLSPGIGCTATLTPHRFQIRAYTTLPVCHVPTQCPQMVIQCTQPMCDLHLKNEATYAMQLRLIVWQFKDTQPLEVHREQIMHFQIAPKSQREVAITEPSNRRTVKVIAESGELCAANLEVGGELALPPTP